VPDPDRYPRRLIEVDLPIKRISAHARREKSIRHGHISTLHIWWARRPLAACRAVVCAALWPDPGDEVCPDAFRTEARRLMAEWAAKHLDRCSTESFGRFAQIAKTPEALADAATLRTALLDFIADFANWDNSTVPEYLATSRALTQSAHEALGGAPGTRPLVVDPFAGGRSIPLEALRVGADAFASDLNPIPVLLNKVVLEYIPKYGQRLADEVRKWGRVDQGAGREGTGGVLSKGSRRRHADRVPLGADDPVRRRKVAVTELRRLVGLGFLTVSGERRGVRYGPGPALRL
jgi:adenine-specific DNA methylase